MSKRKYKKEWEALPDLKRWIGESLTNPGEARCKICLQDLNPHLSDLRKHAAGKKHLVKLDSIIQQPSASKFFSLELSKNQKRKSLELKLALFTAANMSINCISELSDILQGEFGKDTVQLGRTKCTALIKKVLAPFFEQELKKDIQNTPFSIIIDETTDISVTKLVAACIRYYSQKDENIVTTYLGMNEIVQADAIGLNDSLRSLLNRWELTGDQMVGLGTDGANVMRGQHHSLFSLMKGTWPHLILLQCVCHGLDLAAKEAVKKSLHTNIEYMIRETYNWFSHSSLRQQAYKEILDLVGFSSSWDEDLTVEASDESSTTRKPLKIISPCNTRWLVLSDCIERILLQYEALQAHFEVAYQAERCFAAKTLADMFKDPKNHLTLVFLHPVLKELNRVNKIFQSDKADNLKIYGELQTFFIALATQILKPAILKGKSADELAALKIEGEFCMLPYDSADLGSVFLLRLDKSNLTLNEKILMKQMAALFLKELFMALQKRLTQTFKLMKNVEYFTLPNFLQTPLQVEKLIAPFFDQHPVALAEMEAKFRQIKTLSWNSTTTSDFWCKVHNYQDANGDFPFRILSQGAIKILTLPISNAEVERAFSQVTNVKSKKRSNMKTDLLEAILICKFGLKRMDKTASDFVPPVSLLNFNSDIY